MNTKKLSQEALKSLWMELFYDFPFAGLGDAVGDARYELACKSSEAFVPVAAILTVVARDQIDGPVPAFVLSGPQGCGKSLQAEIIARVATGEPAAKYTWPKKSGDIQKLVATLATKRGRVAIFDNIEQIGGPELESLTTGKNDRHEVTWQTVMVFTGPSPTVSADMKRRVVQCNLIEQSAHSGRDSLRESLDDKYYTYADNILFAWENAPAISLLPRWGVYDAWLDTVVAAIVYAGGPSVTGART